MTEGERRVRVEFNPSANSVVDDIKQKTAHLINLCDALQARDPQLAEKAMEIFEEAAMRAVKLATASPPRPHPGLTQAIETGDVTR